MTYQPPLCDIADALACVGLDDVLALPAFAHIDRDSVPELVGEFARFVASEIAPIDTVGDAVGSRVDHETGRVVTPQGFAEAYRRFVAAGWPAVSFPKDWGGDGLPWVVGMALQEVLASACLSFSLCPMLTQSGVELLGQSGTAEQQARYLGRLVSGEWTSTMALTEPDAGSDVGALRTRAEFVVGVGWKIFGTKVFITWGDHDLADNIVHFVLARAPGAPSGSRGISLFAVPARLVDPDGSLGERNALRCVRVERKLGIHASPTCVMEFGGATGELVGELHRGLPAMFTMMNMARLSVGVEGLALAERAHQAAWAYAQTRHQGRLPGADPAASVAIAEHPDVQRMLLTVRSTAQAARLLVYATARAVDESRHHPDPKRQSRAGEVAAFLVPLAKAWPTDMASAMASVAIQIHGGLGYLEESGVTQIYRDARITSIYEGTNGIHAIDLVVRKLGIRPESPLMGLARRLESCAQGLRRGGQREAATVLGQAADTLVWSAKWLVARRADAPLDALAGATPFLRLAGTTVGALLLGERHLQRDGWVPLPAADAFFIRQLLPIALAEAPAIRAGAGSLRD